jgi:rhodanese-related sulfurtransferase
VPENSATVISEMSPIQLAAALKSGDGDTLLLVDVREPHEWAAGRLPGSVHIPLATPPQRLHELVAGSTPVFICHSGGRSMAACRFLAGQGRASVNLAGGVQAWSQVFGAPPLPHEHQH